MSASERRPIAAFITLGCKANRYDSAAMMAMLPPEKYRLIELDPVAAGKPAEVYVINTCAVTGKSAFQSRQMVRRARRWNPDARVIATGCLARIDPDSLKKAGADLVAGPDERGRALEFLGGPAPPPGPIFHHPQGGCQSRGRAVVKIQDGCDSACAYCVVTRARGPSRSLPPDQVISQLGALARAGFAEAVLTGIHLGLYGRDLGCSLVRLLEDIGSSPGMPRRIRISSIEPQELTDELIEMMASSKYICPHLHLPLQSGDPGVLAAMKRPYTPERFSELVESARRAMPHAAIGIDVIAGFPGESGKAHQKNLELIESLPVSYLHVFPFSARPNTEAEKMAGEVPPGVIKGRARELREIGAARRRAFLAGQKGRVLNVLAERREGDALSGTSENYIRVRFPGSARVLGSIVPVRAQRVSGNGLMGNPVSLREGQEEEKYHAEVSAVKNEFDAVSMDAFEQALGHRFIDRSLLLAALTHSSYAHEQMQANNHEGQAAERVEHYERLEFLGDAVLDLVVSDLIMRKYPRASEGMLSRIRAGMVNAERLAELARRLEAGSFLRLGKGEESTGGRDKPSILADAFEALVGAVYFDAGYEAAFEVIRNHLQPLIDRLPPLDLLDDYKTPLQEKVQAILKTTPRYRVISEEGPDHEKTFEVEVIIDGRSRGRGQGHSKKEAEQDAARNALLSGMFDE